MRSVRLLVIACSLVASTGMACSSDSLTDVNAPMGLELRLLPALDTIFVTDSIRAGDNVSLQLLATSFGRAVQTPKGVEWTSQNTAVATVDSAGVVRPTGAGTTTVTARVNDDRATSTIVVVIRTTQKSIVPSAFGR